MKLEKGECIIYYELFIGGEVCVWVWIWVWVWGFFFFCFVVMRFCVIVGC